MKPEFLGFDRDEILAFEVPKGADGAVEFRVRRPYSVLAESIWVDPKKLESLRPSFLPRQEI